MTLRDSILVAVGGALGALARFGVHTACISLLSSRFPWGTLLVNVLGCFLLGLLATAGTQYSAVSRGTSIILGSGFLGAFTTFSTFGIETVHAWQRAPVLGVVNVSLNLGLGILATLLGIYAASKLLV